MARASILRTLMSFAATAMLMEVALAVNHTVGSPNGGWDTTTDLKSWASSQRFLVGDNIVFKYGESHSVFEVSKTDYDSCQTSSPIMTDATGTTTIALTATGSRYFICGSPGHCGQGMKVEIDTLAASSPAPTTTPSAPPPPPPVSSLSPSSSKPPANSPPTKTPANAIPSSETLYPPSSARMVKMNGRSIMGCGILMMMLLSV